MAPVIFIMAVVAFACAVSLEIRIKAMILNRTSEDFYALCSRIFGIAKVNS